MSKTVTEPHKITLEEVDRIATLSRLSPNEAEREQLASEMSNIINFVEQLNELDTSSVEPLHHVLDMHSVLRDDIPRPSLSVEEALGNAPQRKGNYFLVPKVIKGAGE